MHPCFFRRILQQATSFRVQESSGSLLPGVSSALLGGRRSNSTGVPDVQERTLIAVKPDGVQRRLVGQIIQRFEQRGFKLVGLKMLQASEDLLSQHYCELRTKPFYPRLLSYMNSGPVVAMVWEGHKVVETSRLMVGPTNPAERLRQEPSEETSASTSAGTWSTPVTLWRGAQREIQLWFKGKELVSWDCCDQTNLFNV